MNRPGRVRAVGERMETTPVTATLQDCMCDRCAFPLGAYPLAWRVEEPGLNRLRHLQCPEIAGVGLHRH